MAINLKMDNERMCNKCRLPVEGETAFCGRCGTELDGAHAGSSPVLYDLVLAPLLLVSVGVLLWIADLLKKQMMLGLIALLVWSVAAAGSVYLLHRFRIARPWISGGALVLVAVVIVGLSFVP